MPSFKRIANCIWFDNQAEDAARFYVSIFPNSKLGQITHYGEEGKEIHGRPAGSVLTVTFDLGDTRFSTLNGGPDFKPTEAISFEIHCDNQKDIDYFWDKLSAGGDPKAQQCGWLKDKFGVSWQVVPIQFEKWLDGGPTPATERVMKAMFPMKKLDIAELERAYQGK